MKEYRINGFEQIKAFYSWVFNNPDKARPTHVSLYLFLLNQANRSNWAEWFKCPYDLAMQGACIGNNGTYYKCLDELKAWHLIEYQKGINNYKAPLIHLFCLYDTEQLTEQVTVPLSEQASEQLTEQLPVHIYKVLTSNIKQITDNWKEVEDFILNISKKDKIDYEFVINLYHTLCPKMNKVQVISDQRKSFINARYTQFGLEKITEVIQKAGDSEFLNGNNDKVWKADFEWIMRPNNFVKVLEGKYNKSESDKPKFVQ